MEVWSEELNERRRDKKKDAELSESSYVIQLLAAVLVSAVGWIVCVPLSSSRHIEEKKKISASC